MILKIEELREATRGQTPIFVKMGATRVFDDVRLAWKAGADAVVIDGMEGGTGASPDLLLEHTGIPTLAAVCEARAALEDVGGYGQMQLIMAGGIRSGVDAAKALALGADGINMGTRFTATVEAPIHQAFKDAMVATDERGTDLIFRTFRNTARVARNDISQAVVEAEREGKDFAQVADLVKGVRGREGLQSGDTNHGIWSAGMIQGLIHDIPTCHDLVTRIVADAEAIIRQRLSGMLV